jgi:hypothetical protein
MAGRIILRLVLGLIILSAVAGFSAADRLEKVFSEYKKDELKYFEDVAFQDDRLWRWRKPIEISAIGADPAMQTVLDGIIREVKPLLGDIPITRQEAGNILIHYPETLSAYASNYLTSGPLPLGYALPKMSGSELVRVDVYIHPLLVSAKKEQVLKHEICHALGLLQHSNTLYAEDGLLAMQSTAKVPQNEVHPGLSRLDRAAIRLLYDPRIGRDFTKSEFLRKIRH